MSDDSQPLRRLRDHGIIRDWEAKARLDPRIAAEAYGLQSPGLERASQELFGATIDEAHDALLNREDPQLDPLWGSEAEVVAVLRDLGWDVLDDYGRPLLVLIHFQYQLAAAVLGIAGRLPGHDAGEWGASISRSAQKFVRSRP